MIGSNKIFIAAAGSGKTTFLVHEALKVKDDGVLITTYTESNEAEIKRKFLEINGHIPSNIVVMTWFTFLITHGIKPFQGSLFEFPVEGMLLMSGRSGMRGRSRFGPIYWGEEDFERYYFDSHHRVYSDKLSKLVVRCNESSQGNVIDRISRVFRHIFIDEVQDLAGYDLDILIELFKSPALVLLVGDPRQTTYLTHNEAKYKKYANGQIVEFIKTEIPRKLAVHIDTTTLNTSHRNSPSICEYSSKLYPGMTPSIACACTACRNKEVPGTGLFIVQLQDCARYLEKYKPMQLRDKINSAGVDSRFPVMNFGQSKGCGFDRIIILPTQDMLSWMRNSDHELKPQTRARLYVALTRARYSVAVVADWSKHRVPTGFSLFK